MLKIGHEVTRPGRKPSDPPIIISVPEELETMPGIPTNQREVDWYAREYPLEDMNIVERASFDWGHSLRNSHPEVQDVLKEHDKLLRQLIIAGRQTGDLEPTAEPSGEDVTELIRTRAREIGFVEVGFAAYDHRYTFKSAKSLVKFEHAICLGYEQLYGPTQTIPSAIGEVCHVGTYRKEAVAGLALAEYIRSLGYRAQVHAHNADVGADIPMFINAGLGQLGACGYLLSPSSAGNRLALMLVTTNARVTYDQPVDYGMHAFCQICQVCVNRCPGRALMRDKIWWRGIEKNKAYYKRCRPVMSHYLNCGICMKVCPIQKYGMKTVLEHYAATGQVLGKGTHDLEGFSLEDKGYFGPGEMPVFERNFFSDMPHGTGEDWAFEKFKQKAVAQGGKVTDEMLHGFKEELEKALVRAKRSSE